jgi:parallel beta-helix repeat protein
LLSGCIVVVSPAFATPAPCPAGAIRIKAGADIQRIVSSRGSGTSFCLTPGEYRMQAIRPKRDQKFYGEGNAILNGSRLLTTFHQDGALWYASGQMQQGFRNAGDHCTAERPRCDHPEMLLIDDRPLLSVTAKADVTGNTFFFDYDTRRIYFAKDPTGRKVEASVSPYAFLGGQSGVVIDGLTVEKYSTPIQFSAIGYNMPSENWTVRENEIRLNYGIGVGVGANSVISRNFIHDNGEMGIACNGKDILIETNRIARNGWFSGLDPAWEGGGGKCVLTNRLIFRGNYSFDNNAYGFWTDIDNINTLYEDNRIEHNANGGISHEISYAATIRNNTLKGNGWNFNVWLWGGAIQIQNSRDVEVSGNHVTITGAGNGITLIYQSRGTGKFGRHDTVDNSIHNNTIVARERDTGAWGAIADYKPGVLRNGNNSIDHNTYILHDKAHDQWAWIDNFYTWADYRQKSGQDRSSQLILDPK